MYQNLTLYPTHSDTLLKLKIFGFGAGDGIQHLVLRNKHEL
jgi:hypothetical protein